MEGGAVDAAALRMAKVFEHHGMTANLVGADVERIR